MKKIVSKYVVVNNDMDKFTTTLTAFINLCQEKDEEVDVKYSYSADGNAFSALVLGYKEVVKA